MAELTGTPLHPSSPRPSLHDWLVRWTLEQTTAREQMDSLVGVLHHAGDAWARREADNVLLVHYADLSADLDGQMRRLGRSGSGRVVLSEQELAVYEARVAGLAPAEVVSWLHR